MLYVFKYKSDFKSDAIDLSAISPLNLNYIFSLIVYNYVENFEKLIF